MGLGAAGTNLKSEVDAIWECRTAGTLLYPYLASGVAVASANADWVFGPYAVVVPANAITNRYHVLGICLCACDQDACFMLELYQGDDDALVGTVAFAVKGGFWGNAVYPLYACIVPANERLRARLASSNGSGAVATARVYVMYHLH